MLKQLIVGISFPQEDNAPHVVDESLAIIPVVKIRYQVRTHNEGKLMGSRIHLFQLVNEVHCGNRVAIFDLDGVNFHGKTGRKSFLDCKLHHL